MSEQGFHFDRLHPRAENPREVAFAQQWDDEHDFEHRRSLVHHLIPDCTERDRVVVATVIQWLGSNVGMSFIEDVIRKSPEVKKYLQMRGLVK
jgi:hypothetical protein